MKRNLSMAAWAVTAILALATFALAQDYDRDDRDGDRDRGYAAQAQHYGYDNGYRDGVASGRHEGRENDPYDYHTPHWRQATRGYQPWMGPLPVFQRGYQQGYAAGFRSGFLSERPGFRDGDRDDFRRESYDNAGFSVGYQDGAQTAREDVYHGKPFNPNPRGKYDDMDHGYRREYGDKGYYKSQYAAGYRSGYEAGFSRRY